VFGADVFVARYFSCTPLYGLFAPASKVSVAAAAAVAMEGKGGSSAAAVTLPPRRQVVTSAKRPSLDMRQSWSAAQLGERSASRESLSSLSSVTSSASRSRVRLGVTAALGRQVEQVVC